MRRGLTVTPYSYTRTCVRSSVRAAQITCLYLQAVVANYFLAADSRGNRLQKYRVTQNADGSELYVDLLCVQEIDSQILEALPAARELQPDLWEWSHRIRFNPPYYTTHRDLFDLLQHVLTLTPVPEIDIAIVLDFYKIPDDTTSPDDWKNTEAGELVSRAKYWARWPGVQKKHGGLLADRLAEVIRLHPIYQAATSIVSVPGTKPASFGEKLAQAVASRVSLNVVPARRLSSMGAPAKQGHQSAWPVACAVDADLSGKVVIVVDDVYRSGGTMRGVAAAARQAGAVRVLGLAGARTLRKN